MLERHPGALVRHRDARDQSADGQRARGRRHRVQGGDWLRVGVTAAAATTAASGFVADNLPAIGLGLGFDPGFGQRAHGQQRRVEPHVAELEAHAQFVPTRAELDRVGDLDAGKAERIQKKAVHSENATSGRSANTVRTVSGCRLRPLSENQLSCGRSCGGLRGAFPMAAKSCCRCAL